MVISLCELVARELFDVYVGCVIFVFLCVIFVASFYRIRSHWNWGLMIICMWRDLPWMFSPRLTNKIELGEQTCMDFVNWVTCNFCFALASFFLYGISSTTFSLINDSILTTLFFLQKKKKRKKEKKGNHLGCFIWSKSFILMLHGMRHG